MSNHVITNMGVLNQMHRPTQPGHRSLGDCNENWL